MISEAFLLCVDIFVTLIVVPPLLLVLAPFWLYKSGVWVLARIFHPEFMCLSKNDAFTVWDAFKPANGRHVYNVGVAVRVNGVISVHSVRQRIVNEVLCDKPNGEKLYPRLFEEFVLFGGYAFRRKLLKLDIMRQIREVQLGMETIESYKAAWIEQPYGEGMAPWEIVVISQPDVGETIALLKIHHAMADAYSLLYMFDTFLDNKLPMPPMMPKDSFWKKVRQLISAVRLTIGYNSRILQASAGLPFKMSNKETQAYVASTTLYFPDIKLIRRKTGASYTAIILSLFGGVLSRVLLESDDNSETVNKDANRATFVQLSFPWPNHPLVELCNHWTSGGIRVPLGRQSVLDRLKSIENDYQKFIGSDMHKVMKRFLFPIGLLMPIKIFAPLFEFTRKTSGLRTILTSVIGFNEKYYEFNGVPIISVSPLTGLLGTTPVISGLAFAYKDQMQCSFIASSELAKDQDMMDRIVKSYFAEEVDKLVQQVEEVKPKI